MATKKEVNDAVVYSLRYLLDEIEAGRMEGVGLRVENGGFEYPEGGAMLTVPSTISTVTITTIPPRG